MYSRIFENRVSNVLIKLLKNNNNIHRYLIPGSTVQTALHLLGAQCAPALAAGFILKKKALQEHNYFI